MLIGGISERTKLPWAHNTLFFMCLTSVNINQCTSSAISYNNIHFSFVIMSSFLLKKKKHMREALLFYFNLKKSTAESNACRGLWRQCFIGTTCRDWFRRFNDDNFDLSDKKRENRPRKGCFEDCQLQALLDEDDTQLQKMLASEQLGVFQAAISMRLHAMGKV